jgi:hypothetical protein
MGCQVHRYKKVLFTVRIAAVGYDALRTGWKMKGQPGA